MGILTYNKVAIEAVGYELPPHVVTSAALEARLAPLYEQLKLKPGQVEALTGVRERRYWNAGQTMAEAAVRAGRKALAKSAVAAEEIGLLIYGGVCRDQLEPATACAIADGLGLGGEAQIYDVSNACLGVLNGILQAANAIELGQMRAGLVVSCESARQIVDVTIDRLLSSPTLENFRLSLATLTGGSGAVAVVVAEREAVEGHALLGGVARSNARHHELCRWGPDTGVAAAAMQAMRTDSVGVLQHGVALGVETWRDFQEFLAGRPRGAAGTEAYPAEKPMGRGCGAGPDKVICHQVGAAHQSTILKAIGLPPERDFTTFEHLGNMGTVSLPLTLAVAGERGFLRRGDRVGLLGIGSGLNCLMLGVDW